MAKKKTSKSKKRRRRGPMEALFARRGTWVQGRFAENIDGVPVFAWRRECVKWCVLGALTRCYGADNGPAFEKLAAVLGSRELAEWNDRPERTQKEVLELCRKAGV